jgi:putative ABC transport system ATP-binding protein
MAFSIELDSVTKIFRSGRERVEAIKGLNGQIEEGEAVLFSGPSGSGKSTLLNIVGCLTRPTAGRVFMRGREVSRLADHFRSDVRRNEMGFIFQQFNLLAGYTALDNVAMPLIPLGLGVSERRRRAGTLLERLGLMHRATFAVNELSGGEQQRVAIARALIGDPWLILADEPSSNVDEKAAHTLLAIFDELKGEGRTLIIASHDRMFLESDLIDRKLVLPAGEWICCAGSEAPPTPS